MILIIACSGDGAPQAIWASILYAQANAIVVAMIAVLSAVAWMFARRLWGLPVTNVLLLACHPAWSVSAISGDCGMLKAFAATVFTVVAGLGVYVQVSNWLWPRSPSCW